MYGIFLKYTEDAMKKAEIAKKKREKKVLEDEKPHSGETKENVVRLAPHKYD